MAKGREGKGEGDKGRPLTSEDVEEVQDSVADVAVLILGLFRKLGLNDREAREQYPDLFEKCHELREMIDETFPTEEEG
jgi:hypothetical protein